MLQRDDVILVEEHGLIIPGFLLCHLFAEALGLVLGVVQLGETVGNLAATDEKLETISNKWIAVRTTCQRRYLGRVLGNEGRVLETVLDGLLENLDLHLAKAVAVLQRNAQSGGNRASTVRIRQFFRLDVRIELKDRVEHAQARKRITEIASFTL